MATRGRPRQRISFGLRGRKLLSTEGRTGLNHFLDDCPGVPNSRWPWGSVAHPACGRACARSRPGVDAVCPLTSKSNRTGASRQSAALCHKATYAVQQKLRSIRSPRRCRRSSTGNFWMRRRNFIALLAAARWPGPRGPTAWLGGAIFPIKSNRGFAVLARSRDLPRARSRALPAPPGQNS